jgi:glycosyltransferase involved in cell wall biosynthesis
MAMKVLHVNDVASVGSNLVHGLRQIGIEAELFQPTKGTYRASNLKRVFLPFLRTSEAFHLRRYVKREGFNIVHIHYARFAYMALITGLPYVLHCHGSDVRKDLQRPGLRKLVLIALRQAQQVFYSTPALFEILRPIRPDAIFLPNPVDVLSFVPDSDYNHKPLGDVLSISKMDEDKGVPQLIKTIEIIWQTRRETQFGVMGFGNCVDQSAEFLHRSADSLNLKIYNRIPHTQMATVINSYKIILGHLSSQLPVLNVSEIEAMACKKPVVCNFAFPKAYTDPPPVQIAATPDKARNHILQLLDDPEYCCKLGESGREWVLANHESRHVAEILVNHYIARQST